VGTLSPEDDGEDKGEDGVSLSDGDARPEIDEADVVDGDGEASVSSAKEEQDEEEESGDGVNVELAASARCGTGDVGIVCELGRRTGTGGFFEARAGGRAGEGEVSAAAASGCSGFSSASCPRGVDGLDDDDGVDVESAAADGSRGVGGKTGRGLAGRTTRGLSALGGCGVEAVDDGEEEDDDVAEVELGTGGAGRRRVAIAVTLRVDSIPLPLLLCRVCKSRKSVPARYTRGGGGEEREERGPRIEEWGGGQI
jgi:hypothetical protein